MLVIRNEQMEILNRAPRQDYVLRVAGIFAGGYPQRFADLAGAAAFIESNIPRALQYGITSELHVAKFLDFLIHYGEDFEARPECEWAVYILNSREGSGNDRVEWLEARRRTLAALKA